MTYTQGINTIRKTYQLTYSKVEESKFYLTTEERLEKYLQHEKAGNLPENLICGGVGTHR